LATRELVEFIRQTCSDRGLSIRGLSVNAGLSPGTINNILNRQYQPTIFVLNQIADYLGVKRQYLWQIAGLLKDMNFSDGEKLSDPLLKYCFLQADNLPEPAKNLIVKIIKPIIEHFRAKGTAAEE